MLYWAGMANVQKRDLVFTCFYGQKGGTVFWVYVDGSMGAVFLLGAKLTGRAFFFFFFFTPEACRWMALPWSLQKSSRCCSCFTYIVLLPVAALMMRHLLYLWRQLVFVRHNEIKIQPLMKMKEIGKRIKFSSLSLSLEKFWWLKMSEILVEHLGSFLKDIF